jgi:peptidoglycan/LPS O-acetylase OafA/YrhL
MCHRLALTYLHTAPFLTFMFIGVAFNYAKKGKMPSDLAYLLMASLFALFCIQWSSGPYNSSFPFAWNYGFALLAFGFAYSFNRLFKGNRFFDFIAGVSYPLYVAHGIAGYVALEMLVVSGIRPWLALAIVTLAAISVAWMIHVLVEKPTMALGKALARRIDDRLRVTPGSHASADNAARAA